MKKETKHRTWVEVDRKAIARNVARLKRFLEPTTRFMAVVKSNAYGHDMIAYARELSRLGVDFFGVDDIDEALELREAGLKEPMLVLGYTMPSRHAEAATRDICVTISSADSLAALVASRTRFKKPLRIHIKVDTGLHRQGMMPIDKARVTNMLADKPSRFEIEGLYSHFAALESPDYIDYSRTQAERLAQWQDLLLMHGYDPIVHASASAGVVWSRDDFRFDMVRAGIALYGLWPSEEIRTTSDPTALRPVLSWKTIVSEVKDVSSGSRIGYDLTETLSRDSTIAVIPVGYWHGYPRSLSSRGEVLVRGKRAKVLGRISMDMTIIDVTGISGVREGDEVVLIGKQGRDEVTAEDVAAKAGTINYEMVTRINPLIKRQMI